MIVDNETAEWTREEWQLEARQLLNEIGPGLISPSAYDTAWLVRLMEQDAELGKGALEWLCQNQLPDGSWGTGTPVCYQDRIICTLSAMTALARFGRRAQDRKAISNGLIALETLTKNATRQLVANPASSTVGFEMLAPALIAEAEELGIISSQGNRILGRLEKQRRLKLAKLAGSTIDRTITAAFSVEMVRDDLSRLDLENLQEKNGSIAYSPSATAFYLIKVRPEDPAALTYLHQVVSEGAVPYVGPAEVFECAWTLWNLALTDWSSELKDLTHRPLQELNKAWDVGIGLGAATGLSLIDGDCTAMTYEAAKKWGGTFDIDSLLYYEGDDHFRCYTLEVDPSTSTNIHLLGALRQAGFKTSHPSVQKIFNFLVRQRQPDHMWVDKWNLSPYYPTAHAIIACAGYNDGLVQGSVKQILASQNADGSWGYMEKTAEETAYALQALCVWKRSGHQVDNGVLENGLKWLKKHSHQPYANLWIGKCLYTPIRVVTATILSAIGRVTQELRGEI